MNSPNLHHELASATSYADYWQRYRRATRRRWWPVLLTGFAGVVLSCAIMAQLSWPVSGTSGNCSVYVERCPAARQALPDAHDVEFVFDEFSYREWYAVSFDRRWISQTPAFIAVRAVLRIRRDTGEPLDSERERALDSWVHAGGIAVLADHVLDDPDARGLQWSFDPATREWSAQRRSLLGMVQLAIAEGQIAIAVCVTVTVLALGWRSSTWWTHLARERYEGRCLCPKCRYSLTGLAAGTCPECGLPLPPMT